MGNAFWEEDLSLLKTFSAKKVRERLAEGFDSKTRDSKGRTLLDALFEVDDYKGRKKLEQMSLLLLDAGCPIRGNVGPARRSKLELAVHFRFLELLDALLKQTRKPDLTGLLWRAVTSTHADDDRVNYEETIRVLIDHGAKLGAVEATSEVKSKVSEETLLYAIEAGEDERMLRARMKKGPAPKKKKPRKK